MSKAPADFAHPHTTSAQTDIHPHVTYPADIMTLSRMNSGSGPSGGSDVIGLIVNVTIIIVVLQIFVWKLQQHYINGIDDKYVLVTGCDGGIGRLAALRLDALGCHVFAGCRTDEAMMSLQNMATRRLVPILLDITAQGSINSAFQVVIDNLPPGAGLWGIVNNAEVPGKMGPLPWLLDRDFYRIFSVNVIGTAKVTSRFLQLVKKTQGRIVLNGSIHGRFANPFTGAYSMSKFAVEAYADVLRRELYVFGVTVSLVESGNKVTSLYDVQRMSNGTLAAWEDLPEEMKDEYGEEYFRQVLYLGTKMVPLTGSMSSDDVAECYEQALFSIWPKSRYTVGVDAMFYLLASYLPTFLSDIVYRMPGLRAVPQNVHRPAPQYVQLSHNGVQVPPPPATHTHTNGLPTRAQQWQSAHNGSRPQPSHVDSSMRTYSASENSS